MGFKLSHTLYTAAQSRELDRIAIEDFGIPGIQLMKRAGTAAFKILRRRRPEAKHISVYCGGGNNGGDGYIVAGLAAQQHIAVDLIYLANPDKLRGDAALARDFAAQAGVEFTAFAQQQPKSVVVDALLGTGSKGAPRGDYAAAIETINAANVPVLAIDIASGLDADTGTTPGAVIQADATISFIGLKRGLFTCKGPVVSGEIEFDSLSVPAEVYAKVQSHCKLINHPAPPPRAKDAHKGDSGHVLVVGGDIGMGGAVLMAAEAAARCGAGLVSVATQAANVTPIISRRPEIMAKAVASADDLSSLIDRATVIVAGPGLGQSDWSRAMLSRILETPVPKVIDADALNLIAASNPLPHSDKWVLTPHPGEAARLLKIDTQSVQQDRFAAAAKLQQQLGGVLVLKGVGTLVASPNTIGVCLAGNPGMGSGGMGDVLSGVIGALIAQSIDLPTAAEMGVQFHAEAGDRAAQRGQRGLLATDLLPHLRSLVNGL